MQEVHILMSEASLSGKESELLRWLQNVTVSGKSVGLLPSLEAHIADPGSSIPLSIVTNKLPTSIQSTFEMLIPAKFLTGVGTRMLASFTEDETDAEVTDIPLVVVPHAPLISFRFDKGSTAFLLPEFSDSQQSYALCGGRDTNFKMSIDVSDARFTVQRMQGIGRLNCNRATKGVEWMELRVVRKPESCFGPCPRYHPRSTRPDGYNGYDILLDNSPDACLDEAMKLMNMSALLRILELMVTTSSAWACV